MADELERRFQVLQRTLLAEFREIVRQHEHRVSARVEEWQQRQKVASEVQQGRIEDSLETLRDMMTLKTKSEPENQMGSMPSPLDLQFQVSGDFESPYAPTQQASMDFDPGSNSVRSDVINTGHIWNGGVKDVDPEIDVTQKKEAVRKLSRGESADFSEDTQHSHDPVTFKDSLRTPLLSEKAKTPPRQRQREEMQPSCLKTLIGHPLFDTVMGVAILANTVFIGYSAEYAVRHYDNPTDKFIDRGEWVFCILFTVEVTLRIIAWRPRAYFLGEDCWWNLFDFSLVASSIWAQLQSLQVSSGAGMPNTMGLRVLRLLRLLKMFRVVRVARFMRELRTIISSIVGSMRTLFWSMVMMSLIMYIFGLVFIQAASSVLPDKSLDDTTRELLIQYFGSVYKSMLTLFMATTGGEDWGPMAFPLVSAGNCYYYLFLFYISFLSMAILNVVMGLFVDAAMKATDKDRIEMIKEAADDRAGFQDNIIDLMKEFDSNGNGWIDKEELSKSYLHPKMQAFMQHLDVSSSEVNALFDLLDKQKAGEVQIEDLVPGCFRVSRGAKSIDIMQLIDTQEAINHKLTNLSGKVEKIHVLTRGDAKQTS